MASPPKLKRQDMDTVKEDPDGKHHVHLISQLEATNQQVTITPFDRESDSKADFEIYTFDRNQKGSELK